jgi:hypothetical protein
MLSGSARTWSKRTLRSPCNWLLSWTSCSTGGNFDERRLPRETVFKCLYVSEGKITRVELNPPFGLIARRAGGSESVATGGA